jgi:hypothetical protein
LLRSNQGHPELRQKSHCRYRRWSAATFRPTVSQHPPSDDDHLRFNRNGNGFDKGEICSGVPYDVALAAVDDIRPLVPDSATMAQLALRWILMNDAMSVVIPGARRPDQALANAAADQLTPLSLATMDKVRNIYQSRIAPHVHQLW